MITEGYKVVKFVKPIQLEYSQLLVSVLYRVSPIRQEEWKKNNKDNVI